MEKKHSKILGVEVQNTSKKEILENIKKNIGKKNDFFHVVSLNAENLVISTELESFKNVLNEANIRLIDGSGVLLGCSFLHIPHKEKVSGADLMEDIAKMASELSLRVLFIGGRPKIAEYLAECYQKKYAQTRTDKLFKGILGFKNVLSSTEDERKTIFSIVSAYRPHFIISSFGSPAQEMWFWTNRESLKGIICMGVGGGFDFAAGVIPRAPAWIRKIGLEWLFRLVIEPWRWKRQLRLFKFAWLIFKERFFLR